MSLRGFVPPDSTCLLLRATFPRRGRDLFAAVCERDLEGIVAKWKCASYITAAVPISPAKPACPSARAPPATGGEALGARRDRFGDRARDAESGGGGQGDAASVAPRGTAAGSPC